MTALNGAGTSLGSVAGTLPTPKVLLDLAMPDPNHLNLSPFRDSDAETLVRWIASEKDLLEWAGPSFSFPFSAGDFREHLQAQTGELFHPLCMVDENTGTLIAYGEVNIAKGDDPIAADLSRIIVDPWYFRGKGLGKAFVKQILTLCFNDLERTRVGLNVYTHNEMAVRCYRRAGFQEEGRRRSVVRCNGAFWDSYVMSLLKDEL